MAFTTSLKRLLIGLLLVMAIFLMILYLNESQSSLLKPASTFLVSSGDSKHHNRLKLVADVADVFTKIPSEKSWTYKCINHRCVRQHYIAGKHNEKRIPFASCSMLCGGYTKIWPEPTKSYIGTSANSFSLLNVQYKIKTPFKTVENLLENAFSVFMDELHKILHSSTSSTAANDESSSSTTRFYRDDRQWVDSSGVAYKKHNNNNNQTTVNVFLYVLKTADIHLSLTTDECYNLTMTHENQIADVKISANTFFGARNGLATLQQLIWFDDEDETLKIIRSANIVDCPQFNYRGLMLDTSRHYFSVESIKRTIVGMSHSKLNRLHWHLTDSQSFPFVSKHYPELAKYGAYSPSEVYTHEDVKDIVDFARIRGIQVIPEIDSPAHAGNGWQWGPEKGLGDLSLCINQQPWSNYCGEPPCGQLNPKNNNTYVILQKLYQELLELTGPTDYFHIGGDEVNLECWAQYFNDTDLRTLWCDFMLQAHQRLTVANGGRQIKMVSVWSSGLTNMPCLSNKDFAVQVWGGSQWSENYQLIDTGFNLVLSHVDAWYLDCGFGNWRPTGDAACSPYRTWQTIYRHKPWSSMRLNKLQMKQILGGEACLWTEQVDETTLDSRIWPRASALAERLWRDPQDENDFAIPKETFNRFSIFRNRLLQLGIKAEPIFPKYCAQNQDECI